MTDPAPLPKRTIREPLEVVVPRAVAAAEVLSQRVKGRDAQLRRSFVRRGQTEKPTPMMSMLRGGRGGEVRLKVYLSLLWIGVAPPHTVTYPARTWATLLGLADPPGRGARRVNEAMTWLERAGFVGVSGERGVPSTVMLKDESGSGATYTLPGPTIKRLQDADKPWNRHAYERVPVELWTNGWMAAMPGAALACFLVLRSVPPPRSGAPDTGSWFSPALLRDRYDMSDDTRQRGMRYLQDVGLVTLRKDALARTSADFQRTRNAYSLQSYVLATRPDGLTSL